MRGIIAWQGKSNWELHVRARCARLVVFAYDPDGTPGTQPIGLIPHSPVPIPIVLSQHLSPETSKVTRLDDDGL
eukprot:10911292-Ditylum_brightwellii.AAC.1